MITTILFDLDDTLFDHAGTARAALAATAAGQPEWQGVELAALYQRYSELLEEMHPQVLAGRYTYLEARTIRFQRLLAPYSGGREVTAEQVGPLAQRHYAHYQRLRRPVAGAGALLEALKPRYQFGIVTNNRTAEQQDKLVHLGMSHLVDALITSEDVGVPKPDPRIYQVALARLRCPPAQAVMVGDNWQADVLGALGVGIRPIWLNRFGAGRPLASVEEITSLAALPALLDPSAALAAAGASFL